MTTRRGTSNGNVRGNSVDRARRRAWLIATWPADVHGYCRCYRCGILLYDPDDFVPPPGVVAAKLTVDRIIPGACGGTYRRNNVRPACGPCNSETGGALASRPRLTS